MNNGELKALEIAFAEMRAEMNAKIDNLTREVTELRKVDDLLHKRISDKHKELDSRVDVLSVFMTETKTFQRIAKWLIGVSLAGIAALGAILAVWK